MNRTALFATAGQTWAAPRTRGLWDRCATVLDTNWAHDHTVPSRSLYPHQWSWDAAFISIGLGHHAPGRAWRDLRTLFDAQWPDGRVPHIVFDPAVADRDYFPGPAFWRTGTAGRPTTAMVQPPAHALAAWELYRHADGRGEAARRAARAELRHLYPRLVAQQRYLARRRDVAGAGLVSIVHPWESGLDDSPAWDGALAAVPARLELLRRHRRRDVLVAPAEHHPTDLDHARYIALAESYRDGGYRDEELTGRHPFLVECPGFNALYGAAEHCLAHIATAIDADPQPHQRRAVRITRALIDRLYDPASGMFHALDTRTGELAAPHCVNGLLPLILPGLPPALVTALLAEACSSRFGLVPDALLPLPSYDRTAADADPHRCWRGPLWLNMNWLIWRGLRQHRRLALADGLRATVLALVDRSGCFEYFHPETGAGLGSPAFSWTAALTLDLLAAEPPEPAGAPA